jgi:excisionase family DNA binding protein
MTEQDALPEVLTVPEVAQYLRISETKAWRLCRGRGLPAFRIGRSWRVRRADLEQLIKRAVSDSVQPEDHQNALLPSMLDPAD